VTYALGQILSGYLGDRLKPQNVILCGFLLTGAMNLSVGFLQNPGILVALWAVNGFAQALMWPPMLAILAKYLSNDEYSRACVWVGWGSAGGTIAVYAGTPLIISLLDYHWVFLICGAGGLLMALAWKTLYERKFRSGNVPEYQEKKPAAADGTVGAAPKFNLNAGVIMGIVMLAIVLHGALRDGVTNWLPTFVSDAFHLDSSAAILTGVLLPIFQIFCTSIASTIYRSAIPNAALCAAAIFGTGALSAVLFALLMGTGSLVTLVLLGLVAGCMHGINFVLVCMVPRYFKKFGHMSLVTGIFNSSTYVGSSVSTYGIALFSHSCGWNATVYLWAGIAAAGALLCLLIVRRWARFTAE